MNDLRPCIRVGRQPHKRASCATQTTTKTKGWKPPKPGVASRKSPLGIAMRTIQPEVRPFFGPGPFAHTSAKNGQKQAQTRPNGRQRGSSGVLRYLNCVPCAPRGPRSVADPNRGPPGALQGHLRPFLAFLGLFGPVLAPVGPPRRGVGGPPGAGTRGSWRPPLGKANPRVLGRDRGWSRSQSQFSFVTCLRACCCLF